MESEASAAHRQLWGRHFAQHYRQMPLLPGSQPVIYVGIAIEPAFYTFVGSLRQLKTRPCGSRTLAEGDGHADVAQRPDEHDEIAVERDEFTDSHPTVDHTVATLSLIHI